MPMTLEGSCHCGAVRFSVKSHTPQPYQRCYCSICRKTDGGGGYAINIMGVADTLNIEGEDAIGSFHATVHGDNGSVRASSGKRHFCTRCGTALWLWDESWPELVHPLASAIDTELPVPPESVHLMLASKASWVEPQIGPNDQCFDGYPDESIEDWHKSRGLWID
ncbi:GFA family protein [Amorphus coralli]|uniref:GFA family protein n=1 Tax=Amorphus coralli TaxID=340680 RepID=UPI0003737109|nr:GFA family protein [Amorphus coralli]